MCSSDLRSGSPAATSSPSRSETSQSFSAPATAISFCESRINYLLGRISDDSLADVEPGADIQPETLRHLHDVQIKVVRDVVKECLDITTKYSAYYGADEDLIQRVQTQCQVASEWIEAVVQRYRDFQLHLESNVPAKEITFKQFDPKGKTSVYEFLSLYEEWCRGYISDTAKARLLFTKYLHPTLTTEYEELKLRKND